MRILLFEAMPYKSLQIIHDEIIHAEIDLTRTVGIIKHCSAIWYSRHQNVLVDNLGFDHMVMPNVPFGSLGFDHLGGHPSSRV